MLFIPDFEEVRNEFQIKNTEKYRKQSQAKLSSMDLLNGFILDGIIGNYKQAELPLMHQNLENIQELITPEKSIFIFEDINQTHIIRKLKKYLTIMMLNPTKEIIRKYTKKLILFLHTITKQKCKKSNNDSKQEKKTKKIQHQLQTNIKTKKT